MSIVTKHEMITPHIAMRYLELNRKNRPIRKKLVSQLADLIRQGKFHSTHQGIAFYESGELADGQHRLSAIAESGIPVRMLVSRGISPEANHCIDRGIGRTARDTLGFLGISASNRDIAIVRCIIQEHDMITSGRTWWDSRGIPSERFSDNFSELTECIQFSRSLSSCPAPAAAAFATAFFTESMDRLLEFANVFNRGVCDNNETDLAAIALRDLVIAKKYSLGNSGRQELFQKTCTAIRHFCRLHSPARLTVCKSFKYTLPEGMIV